MKRFKTGEKVVCIQTSVQNDINVVKGKIYTVAGYSPVNGIGVLIVEAPDKELLGFWEYMFQKIDDACVDDLLSKIMQTPEVEESVLY